MGVTENKVKNADDREKALQKEHTQNMELLPQQVVSKKGERRRKKLMLKHKFLSPST